MDVICGWCIVATAQQELATVPDLRIQDGGLEQNSIYDNSYDISYQYIEIYVRVTNITIFNQSNFVFALCEGLFK